MSNNELKHYGVKGMRWGKWNEETARRYLGGEKIRKTPEERGFYKIASAGVGESLRVKVDSKDANWIKKATDMSSYIKNYNAAVHTVNDYLLPAINKKWKNVDISSDEVAEAKYNKEMQDAFNEALNTVGNYGFYNSPSGELLIGYSMDLSGSSVDMPAIDIYSRNKKAVKAAKEADAYSNAIDRWNANVDKLSDEFYRKHNLPDNYNLNNNPKLLEEYDNFMLNEKMNEYYEEELRKLR